MPQSFDIKTLYQILIYLDSVGWNIGTITHIGNNVFEIGVDNIRGHSHEGQGFMSGQGFVGTWELVEGHVVCTHRKHPTMS